MALRLPDHHDSLVSVGSIGSRHRVGAFFGVPVAERVAVALGQRLRARRAGH